MRDHWKGWRLHYIMKKLNSVDYNKYDIADFHTHILPGMDDGAGSVEVSIKMLEKEIEQNIRRVVATPHFWAEVEEPERFLNRRKESVQKFLNKKTGDFPRIYLGAEVRFFYGMGKSKELKKLCIDGTNYIMVEMPFCRWNEYEIDDLLSIKKTLGLNPILAHIERYIGFQPRGYLSRLIDNEILIQSNSSFLSDGRTKSKALRMLKRGEIHLMGSDAHDMEIRIPNMQLGISVIGEENLILMEEMSNLILKDAKPIS